MAARPGVALADIAQAIRVVQAGLNWKPGSAERHLRTRKVRGHLPMEATLDDYEQLIAGVLRDATALVYVYRESSTPYIAVSATIGSALWLVIFALDGLLETAFIVENPTGYLSKSEFTFVTTLGDLLSSTMN